MARTYMVVFQILTVHIRITYISALDKRLNDWGRGLPGTDINMTL